MKKIKFLLALVVTVAILSTVSFAAIGDCELNIDATKTYSDTMTFDITLAEDLSLDSDGYLGFTLTFDSTAWTATGSSNVLDNVVNKSNYIDCLMEGENTLTAGTVILTVTANVVDAEAAVGSKFVIKNLEAYDSVDDYAYVSGDYKSLEVTAGSTAPTVSDADIDYVGNTLVDANEKEWSDVSVYTVSADVTGEANSLSCAITVNGKTKNENVFAYLNGEKTTVSFRVAIVGAPVGEQAPLTSAVFTVQ